MELEHQKTENRELQQMADELQRAKGAKTWGGNKSELSIAKAQVRLEGLPLMRCGGHTRRSFLGRPHAAAVDARAAAFKHIRTASGTSYPATRTVMGAAELWRSVVSYSQPDVTRAIGGVLFLDSVLSVGTSAGDEASSGQRGPGQGEQGAQGQ